jgi:hypothetical protein
MGVNARMKINVGATAVTALTGAAPQTGAGTSLLMNQVAEGSLSAKVYALATTNTTAITAKWQVADDGATWRDAMPSNNAANVTLVTGTGAAVTKTIQLSAPPAAYGALYARVVVVTATGAGNGLGQDEYSIAYSYRIAV